MGTQFTNCGSHANLREQFNALVDDCIALRGGTGPLQATGLAMGSTKPQVASGAFQYQIAGERYVETAVGAGTAFTASTHDIADGYKRIFVLSIQTGGTITITPGTAVLHAATAAAPATPTGECKMGEVLISTSGAIFDATSDDLDDSHLTVTYTNESLLASSAEKLTTMG